MPTLRPTAIRLAAAAAVALGVGGAVLALRPFDRPTFKQSIERAMKAGDYGGAARQARAFIDTHQKDVEAYGAWIFALAMADRIADAREALEEGKKAFPDLVDRYAKTVSDTLDRIEAGQTARADAESAAKRGLPYLAASKFQDAYGILKEDDRLGLRTAEAWMAVREPVKAVLVLRGLAQRDVPGAAARADALSRENGDAMTSAAVAETQEGWKVLDALGSGDGEAGKARDAFQRAIDLRPDHAALTGRIDAMRSPYIGLAMAAAVDSRSWEVRETLAKAAAKGVPAPSGPLSGKAGTAFGEAMCDDGVIEVVGGAFGPKALGWGESACAQSKDDGQWLRAIEAFDKANRAGVDPNEALSGFEEAKGMLDREWPSRFDAASYTARAACNVAYLKAWLATFATPLDRAALDASVAASTACPTDDFSRKRLNDKVATITQSAAKRDALTLKVCNRSTEDRVRIAYMRTIAGKEDLLLKGWWDVEKGKCQELPASFAGTDEAEVYLTAYAPGATWWPWESAKTTACTATSKVERPITPGEIACGTGEEPRGFIKITAQRKPGRNVVTYDLRNPG